MRLYELILENGCSMSPYVWRTRLALAHKGLECESAPVGFIDIPGLHGGRFKTVPILEDGDELVGDSWIIADYLEKAYPERPALFTSPGERAMVRFFDGWFLREGLAALFGLYALDIHNAIRPADRAYFRASREPRLGATLEDATADRADRLPGFRKAMQPIRGVLKEKPFLGGDTPNYADHIALAGFIWIASVNTLPPLEAGDPLLAWFERGLDLYDGLARDDRRRTLT